MMTITKVFGTTSIAAGCEDLDMQTEILKRCSEKEREGMFDIPTFMTILADVNEAFRENEPTISIVRRNHNEEIELSMLVGYQSGNLNVFVSALDTSEKLAEKLTALLA